MERKLRELVSSLAPSSVWQHNYTCLCQSLVTATAGICFVVLRIVLLDKAMAMQHASPRTRLRASVTEADRAVSARSSADSVRLTMQSHASSWRPPGVTNGGTSLGPSMPDLGSSR